MVNLTLRGRKFNLTPEDVANLKVEHIDSRFLRSKYLVVIGGKEIPVKVALYELLKRKGTNLTLLDFTTQDAVRIFRKLGVPIVVKSRKQNLLSYAGAIKGGEFFNAVKDKGAIYE